MILHLNFAPGKRSKINAAQLVQNLDFCTAAVASGIDVWASSHAKQIPSNFDPHSTIFNVRRVAEGELYLVRDPLDVLKAFEYGIENVVSFLTEGITAHQLEMLVSLMDEKKVETLSHF